MTHGGKRPNAGRPLTSIDERRVMVLVGQGVSQQTISLRFGVTLNVIAYRVAKIKKRSEHADK